MWPWGHLAFGYLCYLPYEWRRRADAASWTALAALAVGTQFPDLVDKPLAWTFHLLPSGRSLAHSLFAFAAVSAVVWWAANRRERGVLGVAFAVGYLSHLVADGLDPALGGNYQFLVYLVWPLYGVPPYGDEGGFVSHFSNVHLTPFFVFQLGLVAAMAVVFVAVQRHLRRAL